MDMGRARPVTRQGAEDIYRRAMTGSASGAGEAVNKGMRAARARDPYLMLGLEQCLEVMSTMSEEQRGQTRRSAKGAEAAEFTEVTIFRKAYEEADKGNALLHYGWIYAAVGEYVGIF